MNKVTASQRELPFLKNLFRYKGVHVQNWETMRTPYPAHYHSPKIRAPVVGAPYIVAFLQLKCPEPPLFDQVDAHLHIMQQRFLHSLIGDPSMDSTIDDHVLLWRNPFACGSKFTAIDLWCEPLSKDPEYRAQVGSHIEATRNNLGVWHEFIV